MLDFLTKMLNHARDLTHLVIMSHLVDNLVNYGLAKVHNENTPLRSVVSMIRTAEYYPAKYLVKIINDAMPTTYIEEEEKLYFNNLLHFISIHFKIHDTVGY